MRGAPCRLLNQDRVKRAVGKHCVSLRLRVASASTCSEPQDRSDQPNTAYGSPPVEAQWLSCYAASNLGTPALHCSVPHNRGVALVFKQFFFSSFLEAFSESSRTLGANLQPSTIGFFCFPLCEFSLVRCKYKELTADCVQLEQG